MVLEFLGLFVVDKAALVVPLDPVFDLEDRVVDQGLGQVDVNVRLLIAGLKECNLGYEI